MPYYSQIDLHTHSNKSDGELPPAELVVKAANSGIKMLALTDHDTISGLHDAKKAAIKENINLISGVELSTQWDNKTIHILGLNIDTKNKLVIKACDELKTLREMRAKKIAQALTKAGIKGSYEYVKKIAIDRSITRYHFARFLVDHKYAKNQRDVFKKFLVKSKPGYVSMEWPKLNETINLINTAGGIAVIAHPLRYKMTATKLGKLIDELSLSSTKPYRRPNALPVRSSGFPRHSARGIILVNNGLYVSPSQKGTCLGVCSMTCVKSKKRQDTHTTGCCGLLPPCLCGQV